ncbi:MAG: DUF4178 domain-containing protein, partial [Pseudomonadota bacterium]
MEREFKCPSCGASNEVTNPGVLMRICDYCKTAIYWDKESVLRAGAKSLDLPPGSRFGVGRVGKITGRGFTVLGRLRYAHEAGHWDEWFIAMDDGEIMWLAEDEGELFLEKPLVLNSPAPPFDELFAGMQFALNDEPVMVEELGEATCVGGEGQVPFAVELGEKYKYADGTATDGGFVFGLEYDERTGAPTAFKGKALSPKRLKREKAVPGQIQGKYGQVIQCASCGKPFEGKRVDTTKMVVCEACGANLLLDEAESRVVGKNKGAVPSFGLEIGMPVTIEETKYEVMGRILYEEIAEGEQYPSRDYVLYEPEKGYLWLTEENGHFTISVPIHMRVPITAVMTAKASVKVGNETFRLFERGEQRIAWVDGALPWVAAVGETTKYAGIIKPPEFIDQEITGTEVELFRGRYLPRNELVAGLPKGVEPAGTLPLGVHACQPYIPSPWIRGMAIVGAA